MALVEKAHTVARLGKRTDACADVDRNATQPGADPLALAGVQADPHVQAELPLRLTIGNASATQLSFRGQPVDLSANTLGNVARLQLD